MIIDLFLGIWFLISFPFRVCWLAIRFVFRVIAKVVERIAHRNENVAVVDDTLSGQSADIVAIALFAGWQLLSGAALWLYSVKDDLRSATANRRVNPVAMLAKLVLIWLLAVWVIGGSILLVREWTTSD